MSDKWAEYKKQFCGCKDASRLNSCKGLPNCSLRADHPERKIAASVVERQPIYQYRAHWNDIWHDTSKAEFEEKSLEQYSHTYITREVYTAPPELAELQAELIRYKSLFEQAQKTIDRVNDLHQKKMASTFSELQATIARLESKLNNAINLDFERRETIDKLKEGMAAHWKVVCDQRTEIERLKGGKGEPVAWAMQSGLDRIARSEHASHATYGRPGQPGWDVPLYAAQPAPVSVVLPSRETMRDLIAEVIGGDTYDCVRVWSAWGVGTMSEDDFVPVVEQEERLYELADACLDKVKELNP